ncbi:MAG TPA: WG repeat-containing protein, partial [Edaphobacter sp.]|nr:WG repeat-containing protein [Edaphobacter sp.]
MSKFLMAKYMRLRRVMTRTMVLAFVTSVAGVNSYAQAEKQVRQITIQSHWAGLGSAGDNTVTIRRVQGAFKCDGQTIKPSLIVALLNSLDADPIVAPDTTNLGITEQWLKIQAPKQHPRAFAQGIEPTRGQISLFNRSFTNPAVIDGVVDRLFQYWRSDDYPAVRVEVTFDDNSNVSAVTTSQYIFMLPWRIGGKSNKTFNADISRAVSALMPIKTANKERLTGAELAQQLTDAVMSSIEREWNLRGSEELVGADLSTLRSRYQVITAEINPWHNVAYGTATYKGEPEEKNLHIMLRKSSFPPNVFDNVVLKDASGHIDGIQQFLDTAGKYEDLVLSIPWLSDFIRQNPKVNFNITYVHDASFGDKALRTFTGDMKLREREDLVAQVKGQQHEIALLQAEGAYWLVFPDKHMILWRHEGYRTLLKWTPADFGEGECSDYKVNNGGCSGREVTPHGQLVPEGKPRDVACIEAWRANHPISALPPDSLFDVMDNGRGGYIDRSGTLRIPLCFESVGKFSEGLARFERDGRWGYVDQTGKIVIEPKFPWAEEFHEGLAHVQVTGTVLGYDGRWGYINKDGQIAIEPTYKQMLSDSDGDESLFSEGLAMVEGDDTSTAP